MLDGEKLTACGDGWKTTSARPQAKTIMILAIIDTVEIIKDIISGIFCHECLAIEFPLTQNLGMVSAKFIQHNLL